MLLWSWASLRSSSGRDMHQGSSGHALPRGPAHVVGGDAEPTLYRTVRANCPHVLAHARDMFKRHFTVRV